MTKPRTSPNRELFGVLGANPNASAIQKEWNAYFLKEGIDGFMDKYECTEANLPERLSEMYHFDRRMYIVGSALQEAICPLLDHLDASAEGEGRADTVVNKGGVLTGYFVGGIFFDTLLDLWKGSA
jgi:shikimate 5-dehydrogenase